MSDKDTARTQKRSPESKTRGTVSRRAVLRGALALGAGAVLDGIAAPLASAQSWPARAVQIAQRTGPAVETITGIGLNLANHIEIWKQISSDLEAVGFKVQIQHLEPLTWLDRTVNKQDFGHLSGTLTGGGDNNIDPDLLLYDNLHSDATTPGGQNAGGYKHAGYDRMVDDQRAQLDQNKRVPIVKQAQFIVADDVPLWIVYMQNFVLAYNQNEWGGIVERKNAGILRWTNHFSYTGVQSKSGNKKVFRVVNNHDGNSINPFIATGGAFNMDTMRWVYDTLARFGRQGEVIGWAARSWQWLNPTTIELKLRPGMKFHDGRPVTSADVKFTFDYAKQHNFPTWRLTNNTIDKVDAPNGETVRITLRRPYAAFEPNILTTAFVAPKHIWENVREPRQFPNDTPVGSGFFKFGRWRRNEEWLFVANKDHWTPPNVDVLVTVIPAQGTWTGQLETAEVDATAIWIYGEQNITRLEQQRHLKVVESPGTSYFKTYLNLNRKPFDDRALRQALYHAINKQKVVDVVFGKRGGMPAPTTFFHPSLQPWVNERVKNYEFSAPKARQGLRDAGYSWDAQGMLRYPS
jgi:peptide/nickel transport system substrate-binding protein